MQGDESSKDLTPNGAAMFEKIFHLSANNTTARTEILAGLTTFLTMAYIIFVNPAILATDFNGNPTGLSMDAALSIPA